MPILFLPCTLLQIITPFKDGRLDDWEVAEGLLDHALKWVVKIPTPCSSLQAMLAPPGYGVLARHCCTAGALLLRWVITVCVLCASWLTAGSKCGLPLRATPSCWQSLPSTAKRPARRPQNCCLRSINRQVECSCMLAGQCRRALCQPC